MRGMLHEELLPLLPSSFLADPVDTLRGMGAEVIKESRLRWAGMVSLSPGRRLFLKRDRSKGRSESLRYAFFPSKGRREWLVAQRMKGRGVCIPDALGWMERSRAGLVAESYYLSEGIGSGVSLVNTPALSRTDLILDALASTVRKIHDAGLFHGDFHAGNFVWDGKALYLLDLHRARIVDSLSADQREVNLAQLFHSLRFVWGLEEQEGFLRRYHGGSLLGPSSLGRIRGRMDQLQKTQWQSRTRRCLKESTEYSQRRERGTHYAFRRDFSLDRLKRVIEAHKTLVREKPSVLIKNTPKVVVSLLDGEEICVKQFLYPQPLDRFKDFFRHSKGRRGWLAGQGLRVRGMPSVKTLGLAEERGWLGQRASYLVMEGVGSGQELDRFLLKGFHDRGEKRDFIRQFGRWLSELHKREIYHRDMKTCNLVASGKRGDWHFVLLDLEDVRFDAPVDEGKIFRNLLQLNTSAPREVTRTDRLRFFREYMKSNPPVVDDRLFLRRLMDESRKRGLVYVSPQGVVTESL